jgi:hypothetical protein
MSCTAYKNFALGNGHATLHITPPGTDVVIPGALIRASFFTEPLVPCYTL